MIGIINYGMGNLASIQNALNYLHVPCEIFSDPRQISQYDKLILPGVGAFGSAMERLDETGFTQRLKEIADEKKVPLLGICLGMQILLKSSVEHGYHKGLGFIDGDVLFLGERVCDLPIPHVGWNDLSVRSGSRLLKGLPDEKSFYFVHSYYCHLTDKSVVTGTVEYGVSFAAVVESDNIFGCQFHPEKSQKNGLVVLRNFNEIQC
jgi:glutamine amidotransferase